MKKPVKIDDVYDLHKILNYVEKKYSLPVYDFYGSRGHFEEWCDKEGLGKKDSEGKIRNQSNLWYKNYCDSPSGIVICPKFDDFWKYFFEIEQPIRGESFVFTVETRGDWPTLMNEIMEVIKKDFGEEFNAYLSE